MIEDEADAGLDSAERDLTPTELEAINRVGAAMLRALTKINVPVSYTKANMLGSRIEFQAARVLANAVPKFEVSNAARLATAARTQMSGVSALVEAQRTLMGKPPYIDFGAGKTAAMIARQFSARQSHAWAVVRDSGRRLALAFFPANLRAIGGVETIGIAKVRRIVVEEGLPLYMVPGPEIAELLLRAENEEARRVILADRCGQILADCREAIEDVDSEDLSGDRAMVLSALAALEGGHHEAAQALTGSIVESLVWDYFEGDAKNRRRYLQGEQFPEAYKELGMHEFIALAPLWRAFQTFSRSKGDPVPATFSRHGSAHTISPEQFTKVNAVQGIMLASSLLIIRDEAQAAQRAA